MELDTKRKTVAGSLAAFSLAGMVAFMDNIFERKTDAQKTLEIAERALRTSKLSCAIAARDNEYDKEACGIVSSDP